MIGCERNIELIEWERKALASGFDVGLLAGPAPEEGFLPAALRQAAEHSVLPRRKEALRNVGGVCQGTDVFDVDTDQPISRERIGDAVAEWDRLKWSATCASGRASDGLPCAL